MPTPETLRKLIATKAKVNTIVISFFDMGRGNPRERMPGKLGGGQVGAFWCAEWWRLYAEA